MNSYISCVILSCNPIASKHANRVRESACANLTNPTLHNNKQLTLYTLIESSSVCIRMFRWHNENRINATNYCNKVQHVARYATFPCGELSRGEHEWVTELQIIIIANSQFITTTSRKFKVIKNSCSSPDPQSTLLKTMFQTDHVSETFSWSERMQHGLQDIQRQFWRLQRGLKSHFVLYVCLSERNAKHRHKRMHKEPVLGKN